ncbi:hypothetical protein [Scytonema sp. PCC 10023]|uniref:hypothetical protein n=1 Tax=Scytonema sp. PCC 10023 TaxID=1680591 RepID=UPI0039C708BA
MESGYNLRCATSTLILAGNWSSESDNFIPALLVTSATKRHKIYRTLLKIIIHKSVPDRPGRSEPRVRKRRPKAYPSTHAATCRTTSNGGNSMISLLAIALIERAIPPRVVVFGRKAPPADIII